jgi:hypothetical protein
MRALAHAHTSCSSEFRKGHPNREQQLQAQVEASSDPALLNYGPKSCSTACLLSATLCCSLVQLLDTKAVGVRREKMYKLDDHLACAVAGITGALW